jgi:hypothetical protein
MKFSLHFSEFSTNNYEFWKFEQFLESFNGINEIKKEKTYTGHWADFRPRRQLQQLVARGSRKAAQPERPAVGRPSLWPPGLV